ncbi:hypothetical protein ABIA00_001344 [Bradyrhizobium ottawaense]
MPSTLDTPTITNSTGQIEREGRELARLGETGDPAVDRGAPADRILLEVGEERTRAGLRNNHILIRQHVEIVVEHLARDPLGLAIAPLLHQPHRRLRHVVAHQKDDQRRHRAEAERHAPQHLVLHVDQEEDHDDADGEDLADREHELPAVAHDLALALGHGFHDVGVAGRDVRAERDAKQEADHDEPGDVRHEGLRQRQHDEHHHRHQEHDAAADLVGQPAAQQRADQGPALRARRGKAQHQRRGIVLLLDEDQHEGDRIEVPGFDQDRGHHQPADLVALGTVVRDE